MRAEMVAFGKLKIDGKLFEYDVIVEAGEVRKRKKKASKVYSDRYGHTPLSADEPIPWGGKRLIVGTGMYGSLPIMDEVYSEAQRRGVEVIAQTTPEVCTLIQNLDDSEIYAVLHITC